MTFEWDNTKAGVNRKKHGVSFEEAETVFADFLSVTINDPLHSVNEERYVTVGMSARGRLLVVAHTDENDTIRIISPRTATKKEKKEYEQG